jgi:hypothetical protein
MAVQEAAHQCDRFMRPRLQQVTGTRDIDQAISQRNTSPLAHRKGANIKARTR